MVRQLEINDTLALNIEFPNADHLQDILECLKELHLDVPFIVGDDGLRVRLYDGSKSSLTMLHLKRIYFNTFEFDESETILNLNVDYLLRILTFAAPGSPVKLTRNNVRHQDGDGAVNLEFRTSEDRLVKSSLNLTEHDFDAPAPEGLAHEMYGGDNELRLTPALWKELCANFLWLKAEKLILNVSGNNCFDFVMNDGEANSIKCCQKLLDYKEDNQPEDPTEANKTKQFMIFANSAVEKLKFDMNHLSKFRAPKIAKETRVLLTDTRPINIKHTLGARVDAADVEYGILHYMLAPKADLEL